MRKNDRKRTWTQNLPPAPAPAGPALKRKSSQKPFESPEKESKRARENPAPPMGPNRQESSSNHSVFQESPTLFVAFRAGHSFFKTYLVLRLKAGEPEPAGRALHVL